MPRAALADLEDVKRYVPAYSANAKTEETLEALLESESESIQEDSGREIVPVEETQPAAREFSLAYRDVATRRVAIGDLASTDDLEVVMLDADGDVAETVDTGAVVPVYGARYSPDAPWKPITHLEFPRSLPGSPGFYSTRRLRVTGTWGFPEIPPFVREAVAKRVILRYVNDVARGGTDLTEATEDLNLGALFASSEEAVELLRGSFVAA